MKIGVTFTAAAVVLGVACVGIGGAFVAHAISDLSASRQQAGLSAVYSGLLVIPERATDERSRTTRVLAPAEITAELRGAMANARGAIDQTIDQTLTAITALDSAFGKELQRDVTGVRDEFLALRAKADKAIQAAHADRLKAQPEFSAASLAIQSKANPIIDRVQHKVSVGDGNIGSLADIGRAVVEMRAFASATVIPMGGSIRQKRPATPDELSRAERGLGSFDATRARLRFLVEDGNTPEQVKKTQQTVEASVLEPFRKRVLDVLAEQRAGKVPEIAVGDWDKNVIDILGGMYQLRDVALNMMQAHAAADVASARNTLVFEVGGMVAVLAALGAALVYFRRRVLGALERTASLMGVVAAGDYTVEIPDTARQDEIGDLARALGVFKENGATAERLRAEAEETRARQEAERAEAAARAEAQRAEAQATLERRLRESEEAMRQAEEGRAAEAERVHAESERERKAAMLKMAEGFEASVGRVVASVSTAASDVEKGAGTLSSNASETASQAAAGAAASEQASSNVQSVAAAAEQLNASVMEISRQVQGASSRASEAVRQAEATNAQVQGLAEAAQRIGDVVKLISDIAAQTNLLALNATIEAARAGDAGKGFAVVASEVKNLASQTAKATDEISQQIAAIQGATGDAVQAIEGIGRTIVDVNQIAASIASAVEEQNASTREIANSVQQAAAGTQDASSNIGGVTRMAEETGRASSAMLASATDLTRQADTLKVEVDRFLSQIRAA